MLEADNDDDDDYADADADDDDDDDDYALIAIFNLNHISTGTYSKDPGKVVIHLENARALISPVSLQCRHREAPHI